MIVKKSRLLTSIFRVLVEVTNLPHKINFV
jgi:hypothetical protein